MSLAAFDRKPGVSRRRLVKGMAGAVAAAARHNVILTPHVAWASDEAQQTLADQLVDNIENFVAGRPSNLVEGAY